MESIIIKNFLIIQMLLEHGENSTFMLVFLTFSIVIVQLKR